MVKNNEFYLIKAINEIEIILDYSKNLEVDDLFEKPVVLDGIVFRMFKCLSI